MSYEIRSTASVHDLIDQSSPAIMKRVLEYANLAAISHPSEEQANQLEVILEEAIDNEVLSFWITEVDHLLGHRLNLLDEDCREAYKDQQAMLREYIETEEIFSVPQKQQILNYLPHCTSEQTGPKSPVSSLPSRAEIEGARQPSNSPSSSNYNTSANQRRDYCRPSYAQSQMSLNQPISSPSDDNTSANQKRHCYR